MSIYAAPVEVANAALAEVGHTQIQSLNDGTPAAVTFNALYEPLVKKELTRHAWSFATKLSRLTLQGATGSSPAYAYYLPGDLLTPRFMMVGRSRAQGYQIRSNKVLVDIQMPLDLVHTYRAPESEWPADFCEGMRKRLMAVFLRALPVDYQRAREMDQDAELQFQMARIRDRTAAPATNYTIDPVLVRAWRGAQTDAQA